MSEAITTQTFSVLRKTRFSGLPDQLKRDMEYIEQLAVQTSTNVDSWPMLEVLKDVPVGDRRAINKAFFAKSKAEEQAKQAFVIEGLESKLADMDEIEKNRRAARIEELDDQIRGQMRSAKEHYRSYETRITRSWEFHREQFSLQNRPPNFLSEDVKKIIADGFWTFDSYASHRLKLLTANDIVMTEINPTMKLNRRVNLGKYAATVNVETMKLTVEQHRNNILTRRGFFHPYVDEDGGICWGNAAEIAGDKLASGGLYEVFHLLASLLTNYSQDSTPWEALQVFDREQDRGRSELPQEREICDDCGEGPDNCDCSRCGTCEQLEGHCDCHYCEPCDRTYADGDSCGGHWCEPCGDCTGREPCETHYCRICSNTSLDRDGICENNCCLNCERRDSRCNRCRECELHDGEHDPGCESAPVAEEVGDAV